MSKSIKVLIIIWLLAGLSVIGAWLYIYKIMARIEFVDTSRPLRWDKPIRPGGLLFETEKHAAQSVWPLETHNPQLVHVINMQGQ